MSKINTRSPYYIHDTVSGLVTDRIDLYIYTGTQGVGATANDRPSDPTYQLSSNAIDDKVTFEISELIKDYFTNEFDGDYASDFFWVDYEIYRSTASTPAFTSQGWVQKKGFYGYGYFEDGVNPQNDSGLLQTNTKIVKLDDAPAVIPVDTSKATQVTYELNGEQIYTKAISSSTESDEQIEYVTSGVNGADEFEDRVIQDDGTFEGSVCLDAFANEFTLFDFDTIYVDTDDGVIKITVDNIEECKYQPYKVTFINKFGALQDIWFFLASRETLSTKKEEYKRNTVVDGTYSISKHQQKILVKNGKEKLSLNTGYYPEEYNEVFKEMQLSEDCWIEVNSQTLPINISSSSLAYKTHLNDKLINYTIEIDYAFDTINNIR
jgi:hypothetical protein